MIEQLRRFLSSPAGKAVAVVLAMGLLVMAIYSAKAFFRGDTPDSAFSTMYVCTETGKAFKHVNELGEIPPILSPFSGKNTGLPAEPCYWTTDGGISKDPTWCLLNSQLGKPEPTFCPVCGRLVVPRNPPAEAGKTPPPTREQWFAKHPRPT